MKRHVILISLLALLAFGSNRMLAGAGMEDLTPGQLELYYSPDLAQVVQMSVSSFTTANPDVQIRILPLGDADESVWVSGEMNLALVTKEYLRSVTPGDVRLSVIGREIFIPVMNPANPCLGLIRESGIAPAEFAAAYVSGGPVSWGSISGNKCNESVHAYRINDPSFLSYLSEFTGLETDVLGGSVKNTCEMVLDAVRTDRLGMGFCTLHQLMELESKAVLDGIALIPVDMNENNVIDHFEQMYGDVASLARGVWIGKYPGALYSRIFAITPNTPVHEDANKYLEWLITEGQEILAAGGFSTLLDNEKATILASLNSVETMEATGGEEKSGNALLLILGAVFVIVLLGLFVFRILNSDTEAKKVTPAHEGQGSSEIERVPGGYFVDRSHTWTFLEKDGMLRIGIDQFLQHITGKISRVNMKQAGDQIKKGEILFTLVQQGKVLEVHSPVAGTITDVNESLRKNGNAVNRDPYGDGWICMLEPLEWNGASKTLLRGKNYVEWIREETVRLKDFIVSHLEKFAQGNVHPVFQDGGELRNGLMEDYGPEAWEEFQEGFLHRK